MAAQHIRLLLLPDASGIREIFSGDFAVSLFFVSYAYSGWNAAAYIAGEIENPQRNLPRSLLLGTLVVTTLYVLLNYVFLYTTPIDQLAGKLEVGYISATNIFGPAGGRLMGLMIALLLVSSVSSMIMTGPRVTQVMGQDNPLFRLMSNTNRRGVPFVALAVQTSITLLLILTSSFERVITYMGFTLNLFTMLAVGGVIVLRVRQPELPRPFRMWGYPYTVFAFLIIGLWILIHGSRSTGPQSLSQASQQCLRDSLCTGPKPQSTRLNFGLLICAPETRTATARCRFLLAHVVFKTLKPVNLDRGGRA